MNLNLFCISDEELAGDRAALSPAELAAVDALPSSFEGFPYRHSSVDSWRMYQQSKGELEAAALVLNCASSHAFHSGGAEAEAILSRLRDQVIDAMNAAKLGARGLPYTGPFPRKRHYHRCPQCKNHGGNGVNCYKSRCTLPVLLSSPCSWCR